MAQDDIKLIKFKTGGAPCCALPKPCGYNPDFYALPPVKCQKKGKKTANVAVLEPGTGAPLLSSFGVVYYSSFTRRRSSAAPCGQLAPTGGEDGAPVQPQADET
eukprot:283320-Pyramimonas_sp.AAC.1